MLKWLHYYHIPVREPGRKQNHVEIGSYLKAFLEGELLGDGHLGIVSGKSAAYQHSSKHRQYLVWLAKELAVGGIAQGGTICRWEQPSPWIKKDGTRSTVIAYGYHSKAYPVLLEWQRRFYYKKKKLVPEDLILNPISARQWYIGDGCLDLRRSVKHNSRPIILLGTCTFDSRSTENLMSQLSSLGFSVGLNRTSNEIRINVISVEDFLDYIGPCPKEIAGCYGYKWAYPEDKCREALEQKKAQRLEKIHKAQALRADGRTYAYIGEKFGVDRTCASKWCRMFI